MWSQSSYEGRPTVAPHSGPGGHVGFSGGRPYEGARSDEEFCSRRGRLSERGSVGKARTGLSAGNSTVKDVMSLQKPGFTHGCIFKIYSSTTRDNVYGRWILHVNFRNPPMWEPFISEQWVFEPHASGTICMYPARDAHNHLEATWFIPHSTGVHL